MGHGELDGDVGAGGLGEIIVHIDARVSSESVLRRELIDQPSIFP